jgi:hypothetical protein
MEQVKHNDVVFKNDQLKNFTKELLDNGFRIIATKSSDWLSFPPVNYVHFSINDKIGYAEIDYFGGINLSTVCKPSLETGTGLSYKRMFSPTVKDAFDCINVNYGQKYKDLDEYIKNETILPKYEIIS